MNKIIAAIVIVLAAFGIYGWSAYNGLINAQETVNGQWAQVETTYQRRFDLIPNLVAAVKGNMQQEKDVFGQLAQARSQYAGAQTVDSKAQAAGQVESAFGRLLAVMENYPQLKSYEAVQTLMTQLEGSENRVSVERERYNQAVQAYEIKIKRFPNSVIANLGGFKDHNYFQATNAASSVPQVKF